MQSALKAVLREIESFGLQNNQAHAECPNRVLDITGNIGDILAHLSLTCGSSGYVLYP